MKDLEAERRRLDEELEAKRTRLDAVDQIIKKKSEFEQQKKELRQGDTQGIDLVKQVDNLNLQAEN